MKKHPKVTTENERLLNIESNVKTLKNIVCTILEKIESKSYMQVKH